MEALTTTRLVLEPLVVAHADAMFGILCDPSLYAYLDASPHATPEHTRDVYARLEARTSPDGTQGWLNWIVVPRGGTPIGFVQATVVAGGSAWIAYLLAKAAQGRGYATEAVGAMKSHLVERYGVVRFLATVERDNAPSVALLERVGLLPATDEIRRHHALTASERLFVG